MYGTVYNVEHHGVEVEALLNHAGSYKLPEKEADKVPQQKYLSN